MIIPDDSIVSYDIVLDKIYRETHIFIICVIAIPGVALNSLTAHLFYTRSTFWKDDNQMGYLFTTQTTFNLMILVTTFFFEILHILFSDIEVICQMNGSLKQYFITISLLFQLLITIERFVFLNCTQSQWLRSIFKSQINLIIFTVLILIIAFPMFLLYLPISYKSNKLFFTYGKKFQKIDFKNRKINDEYCDFADKSKDKIFIIKIIMQITPAFLIIFLNILNTFKLIRIRRRLDSVISLSKELKKTISLVYINFVFLFLMIPFLIIEIYAYVDRTRRSRLYQLFSIWLLVFYESCQFFVNYCSNRTFKFEFLKFLWTTN
jgi:hypothetical protein